MSFRNGSEVFAKALEKYGVKHMFGNPGTTELPLIDEIDSSSIDYVMALHEDIAVGAAAGYANRKRYHDTEKPGNQLGVVNLHTTPGLAHGIGNVYGAHFTDAPLLVTTGSQKPSHEHRNPSLSGDRVGMVEQFCKWSGKVEDVEEFPELLRKAIRKALTPPMGPVFLDIPTSIQNAETDAEIPELGEIPKLGPANQNSILKASKKLDESEEPVIVVGNRLAHAGEDAAQKVEEISEKLGAKVYGEPLLTEISVSTDFDLWDSTLSIHAEQVSPLLDTDTVIFVGCRTKSPIFTDDKRLISSDTTVIEIGNDVESAGHTYETDISLVGEIDATLGEILESLDKQVSADQLEKRINETRQADNAGISKKSDDELISVPELCKSVADVFEDAIIVDEGITSGFILRETMDLEHGQLQGMKSGGLGYGLPAAVGVAIAEESRPDPDPVLAFVGDGSFQYYPQSLYTISRYVDSALTCLIIDNGGYKILRDEEVMEKEDSLSFTPGMRFKGIAESYGIKSAESGDTEERLRSALKANENSFLDIPVSSEE